jgi:hypothetical protein
MQKIVSSIPGVMYMSSGGLLFTVAGSGEKIPVQSRIDKKIVGPFVPWGRNNRLAFEMAETVRASTVMAPAMKKMARLLYADGIKYEFFELDEKGKGSWVEGNDSEIDDWLEESDINNYLRNACYYHYHYENVFAGIQTNLKKDKVTRIWAEKSEQVRYAWQDENGFINKAFINANWKTSNDISKALQVPIIDPTYPYEAQIKRIKSTRFISPLSLDDASADENFYTTPSWYSAVLSDWASFASSIPQFKAAMMKNQIALKYHIEIDSKYWEFKYGEQWDGFSEQRKEAAIRSHIQDFNANMTGAKNALNTLVTHSHSEGDKQISFWKVTPIDDKVKSGVYIEDSQEASSHLLYALGCDPALIGSGPGKNYGSGSGSDKNAAYNIFMMEAKPIHDNLLRPIISSSRFNGYSRPDRRIRWSIGRPMMIQMESGKPKATNDPKAENSNP